MWVIGDDHGLLNAYSNDLSEAYWKYGKDDDLARPFQAITTSPELDSLICAQGDGTLSVLDGRSGNLLKAHSFEFNPKESWVGLDWSNEKLGVLATSKGQVHLLNKETWNASSFESFKTATMTSCFAYSSSAGLVAWGGKNLDLTLFSLSSQDGLKETFKARQSKGHSLDRIWPMDVLFLNDSGNSLVVGTRYGQIKLYDTRSQRRPIQSYQANATYKDRAIQRLLPSSAAEHVLYFSDNVGGVADFDLRKGKMVKMFSGITKEGIPAGCVKDLALSSSSSHLGLTESNPDEAVAEVLLGTVSLDGYARIFKTDSSHSMSHNIYLKNGLVSLTYLPLTLNDKKKKEKKKKNIDHSDDDDDDDEIWERMKTLEGEAKGGGVKRLKK